MGLLDGGLAGMLSDVDRAIDGSPSRDGRPKTFRSKHFEELTDEGSESELSITAGEKIPALRRRVSWGNEERFGYGMADVPRTVGTAYVDLVDDEGNPVRDGDFHLVHNGPNLRNPEIVWSGDLGDLSEGENSKEDREAIPERARFDRATPEEHLEVKLDLEESATIDWDASTLKLPATIYD